jgi:hypothetical protein
MPKTAEPWLLTGLKEKLIKLGAKVVSHGRCVTFQLAEVALSRQMFADILSLIAELRAPRPRPHDRRWTKCAGQRGGYASVQAKRGVSVLKRLSIARLRFPSLGAILRQCLITPLRTASSTGCW